MSIFDKFNNQGFGDEDAFEELCCQLFETWGICRMGYGDCWAYRDIRGAGGDGGIEAYWLNSKSDVVIGLQAKWFRKTITSGQYAQLRNSIDVATELRPNMKHYIVCIPHNLTSIKRGRGGKPTKGEDERWGDFKKQIARRYPWLEIELWDEAAILNHLQLPENEGRGRFWFDKTAINPDGIRQAHQRAMECLKDRYVPAVTDDGSIAVFLNNFFGTVEERTALIGEIDACLNVCNDFIYAVDSFLEIDEELLGGLKESAEKCREAFAAYTDSLGFWEDVLAKEPLDLLEIDDAAVDYAAIERFEADLRDLKTKHKLTGHVEELIGLMDRFSELPGGYELHKRTSEALGEPHCLVSGAQGTGKTCGFANEACAFLDDKKHLPIFIRASEVGDCEGWGEIVSRALGLTGWSETELWQALCSFAALRDVRDGDIIVRGKVAVFVDGLDERQSTSRWLSLIRQGDAITKMYPRIRFAYSSRPHVVEGVSRKDACNCVHRVDAFGDVPVWDLFDRYIERYSIDLAGNMQYKWMLRTPMELHMFCAAYRGRRIEGKVSTCLTSLINAEVNRLEEEFAVRKGEPADMHEEPVRSVLLSLAVSFLSDDGPRTREAICKILEEAGVQREDFGAMLGFLEQYGILVAIRRRGATSVSPDVIAYQPGSRHLWDYFMAVVLVETRDAEAANVLLRHDDASHMYAILLIENRGILPLDNDGFVGSFGVERARRLSIDALADVERDAAAKYRQWALDEMAKGGEWLFDIVNGIVVPVADEPGHPLGPMLLDKYLSAFRTPVERDLVWSIPRKLCNGYALSMYCERDAVRHLPRLHGDDAWNQMPLLLAWCLSSVSNLRRSHCRNQLVRWAMCNPNEYFDLFNHFSGCNDPQIREDMFAIAADVVCQGAVVAEETRGRFAKTVIASVFDSPDMPGNRDAALRHYGRMIVERCCADGSVDGGFMESCRPPYRIGAELSALPIFAAASKATKMMGFESISYNLARYVLVDKLERVFGAPFSDAIDGQGADSVCRLVEDSAAAAGVESPTFEGWVVAAAYQYLLDHGYDRDVFVGPVGDSGYRQGGIDRRISSSFGSADHGSRSTVMTVAEKYVWCVRNEICGFMADRVPVCRSAWSTDTGQETYELADDYGNLLSYGSPLFEATVDASSVQRENISPSFPAVFSCDGDGSICTGKELSDWVESDGLDALIAMLSHEPNVDISIKGGVVPVALYSSDWSLRGKQARCWAYCGAMASAYLANLEESNKVAIDGYDNASEFVTNIDVEATYISPVEFVSASWIKEYGEKPGRSMIADVHVAASPLTGSGVDSLVDTGDYYYAFPSKLAMDFCGVTRTDGLRYFDSDGEIAFEYIDYGEPFRKQYQALLADRGKLFHAMRACGLTLVWYATLQRGGNRLAEERLGQIGSQAESSWLIWLGGNGEYRSCRMSDEYPAPEHTYEHDGLLKELLANCASCEIEKEQTLGE